MKAVDGGHRRVARSLIGAGADVNLRDGWGETALLIAVASGSVRMVKLLLDAGADRDSKDRNLQSALHRASEAGEIRIATLLLYVRTLRAGRGRSPPPSQQHTHRLADPPSHPNYTIRELGVDAEAKDKRGYTAL